MEDVTNPNCEMCLKSEVHCCKADVPYDVFEALFMLENLKGKRDVSKLTLANHPKAEGKFVIIDTDIMDTSKPIAIQEFNCVCLHEGKCLIYENRPSICRMYGTSFMKCKTMVSGCTTPAALDSIVKPNMLYWDKEAMKESGINEYKLIQK